MIPGFAWSRSSRRLRWQPICLAIQRVMTRWTTRPIWRCKRVSNWNRLRRPIFLGNVTTKIPLGALQGLGHLRVGLARQALQALDQAVGLLFAFGQGGRVGIDARTGQLQLQAVAKAGDVLDLGCQRSQFLKSRMLQAERFQCLCVGELQGKAGAIALDFGDQRSQSCRRGG